ncbi:FecR family protein [Flavobacterium sp. ASW18X]|uniref:FecR family protein n=1 Tax=Flavobacterium sp. ASW18X TaxID=2572595 RepID=UPI0010AE8699|nr:FecR family protein [Flavobacterium sp. ASW18X]TKD57940.1 DUF4974 domain-containing protein [Flavobacterium sp. ASW18X]
MTEKELQILIEKYTAGNCSQKEKELVDRVLASYENKEVIPFDVEKEKAIEKNIFSAIQAQIKATDNKKSFSIGIRQVFKVAASLVLLIGLGYMVVSKGQEYNKAKVAQVEMLAQQTDWGKRATINLSDGTKVTLNAGSKLNFPKSFKGQKLREVFLEGEAFFEVAENKEQPFVVHSNAIDTQVLGTSFNVNAYSFNEAIAVTVKTGKVKVFNTKAESNNILELNPMELAYFNKSANTLSKSKVSNENFLDWKNGIIRFNDISFSEAANMLSRRYGITVHFKHQGLKNCHVTARYEKANLKVVLESIKFATKGFDYEIKEGNQVLFKGLCKE